MGIEEEIAEDFRDTAAMVLRRAKGVGQPQTTYHGGIPVTAYPMDSEHGGVDAVIARAVAEVQRRRRLAR